MPSTPNSWNALSVSTACRHARFVIGVLTEAITGQGIIHQIGLGPLVDGYAACSTKFLPFCF